MGAAGAPWDGEHPQEWLSAYVDGELDPGERQAVAAHLVRCPACRDVVAEEAAVHVLLAGLPPVGPPARFLERVVAVGPAPRGREHRRTRAAAVNLVAAAALWIGALGVFGISSGTSVVPDLRALLGEHTTLAESPAAATTPARLVAAPRSLAGDYVLVRATTEGGWPHYLYADADGRSLSVFVRPGQLDVAALPSPRRSVAVNGVPGWAVTLEGQEVVFLQKPGSVVVLVGDAGERAKADVAEEPALARAEHPGVVDHLVGAGRALLETFGLAA
jgi:hypothetical protein